MIKVNALGDACPIPVVKTKKAIGELKGPGVVVTLVDNEIAVQNLCKMADQKGYAVTHQQLGPQEYEVTMTIGEAPAEAQSETVEEPECLPCRKKNTVVVISSDQMGEGSPELGKTLLKGFVYALSQQDTLPATMLFYNGGAHLTCTGSPALEDLKQMEAQGVEIMTCGTCLNHYGLAEQLQVGSVTNMYVIAEKLTGADLVIKP
jgi:selenium metabolism protein YedF